MKKKYELTTIKTYVEGYDKPLYAIRALKDFGKVKAGDFGGYIESESNLSQKGNCWIGENAKVFGNAKIRDNAYIANSIYINRNIKIYDNANISGNASINGSIKISGNAKITDNACIFCDNNAAGEITDNAAIYGNADIGNNIRIYGNANIFENAAIDNAVIGSDAKIHGSAIISGNADIAGNVDIKGAAYLYKNAYIRNNTDYITIQNQPKYCRYDYCDSMTFYKTKDNDVFVNYHPFELFKDYVKNNLEYPLKEYKPEVSEDIKTYERKKAYYNKIANYYVALINLVEQYFALSD